MKKIQVLGGVRTAMCEYVGTPGFGLFKDLSAIELGAMVTREALRRTEVDAAEVNHVVMGNVMQTSADALYGARHVALKADLPIETPALTVNRLCGSGLQAIITGAQHIQLDEAQVVVSGGMENMSQCPHVIRGAREGFHLGQGKLEDLLMASLMDPYCGLFMAQTAEKLAAQYEISREEQDEFAVTSISRAEAAQEKGLFDSEILAVEVKRRKEMIQVDRDDHIKPGTTQEKLSRLRPAFGKEGTVTAGNASGIVDGAAAVVLAADDCAVAQNREVLGTVRDWNVVGVDPSVMGIGPAPAISGLLARQGLTVADIHLFEINEAFSAQYLAVEKELGLDREKVNVNGGAIALGHPLGMTGTRLVLTVLHELRRRGGGLGVASACIGGGQGIAILVEAA
ncbi:MAG: acetyl-CoA C-acyltransferase [Planctomycetota bacterium]|nr:acetyl-CoA C-acyltransferase [Planctomycetota bacterium]